MANLFKSRGPLEIENLFLRHKLNVALKRALRRLRLRGSDREAYFPPLHQSPSLFIHWRGGAARHAERHPRVAPAEAMAVLSYGAVVRWPPAVVHSGTGNTPQRRRACCARTITTAGGRITVSPLPRLRIAAAFGGGEVQHRRQLLLNYPARSDWPVGNRTPHERQRTRAGLRRIGPHQPALSQQGAE
jgi:hypothetical protein